MTIQKFFVAAVITIALLALIGCGGSGGSNNSNPTVGTGTNNLPSVSFTVSDFTVNEGLTTALDASASSDPDNDTLQFTWSQLSGPTVTIENPNNISIDVKMPEVTGDELVVLQLSVTDGIDTITERIELTVKNVILSPLADSTLVPLFEFSYDGNLTEFVSEDEDSGSGFQARASNFFAVFEDDKVDGYITGERRSIDFNGQSFRSGIPFTSVSNYDFVDWTVSFDGFPVKLMQDGIRAYGDILTPADEPCSLTYWGRDRNSVVEFLAVGQKFGGVRLYEYESMIAPDENGNPENFPGWRQISDFGSESKPCVINGPRSGRADPEQRKLFGYDDEVREFIIYNPIYDNSTGTPVLQSYEIGSRVPLELDLPSGTSVELIDSEPRSSNAITLLFSDGETEGVHRLLNASLDENGEITQYHTSWDYGTPTDMTSLGYGTLHYIMTPDSPYAVVVTPVSGAPAFNPPRYLELGLGAAATTGRMNFNTVFAFPECKLVKVFKNQE